MKVYVVMGNDFPDAVYAKEADARAYCEFRKQKDTEEGRRIYWRVYEFEVLEAPKS